MNEKIYEYLMYMILLSIIFMTFLTVNSKISENRIFNEKSALRDLSFIYDLLVSSPNQFDAEININGNYTISITQPCTINIKKEGENPNLYPCGTDSQNTRFIQIDKNKIIIK